jgi:hypothetical protein
MLAVLGKFQMITQMSDGCFVSLELIKAPTGAIDASRSKAQRPSFVDASRLLVAQWHSSITRSMGLLLILVSLVASAAA